MSLRSGPRFQMEQIVVGGLMDPIAAPALMRVVSPELFEDPSHCKIVETIQLLYQAGQTPDMVAVSERHAHFAKAAADAFALYSGSHGVAMQHALRLGDLHYRDTIRMAGRLMVQSEEDPIDIMDKVEGLFNDRSLRGFNLGTHEDVSLTIGGDTSTLESRMYRSGFPSIDDADCLGGWESASYNIVGADSGTGKTWFMLAVGVMQALAGHHVEILTLEMSTPRLRRRILSMLSGVTVMRLRDGNLSTLEKSKIQRAIEKVKAMDGSIRITKTPTYEIGSVVGSIRRAVSRAEDSIVWIDHLQKIVGNKGRRDYEAMTNISLQLADLSRVLGIPIIALSQLTISSLRNSPDKVFFPTKNNLRGSGDIAQDADTVSLLYRPSMYGISALPLPGGGHEKTFGRVWFIVDKKRDSASSQGRSQCVLNFGSKPTIYSDPVIDDAEDQASLPF